MQPPHAVDADGVHFHDPAREGGGKRTLPADEFQRRWFDMDAQGRRYIRYGIFLTSL